MVLFLIKFSLNKGPIISFGLNFSKINWKSLEVKSLPVLKYINFTLLFLLSRTAKSIAFLIFSPIDLNLFEKVIKLKH